MKKFLVAMAAVLAMTVTVNAKDNNKKACTDPANCDKQEQQCQKSDQKCDKEFCPFEGLNLTDAQKTQLQELKKSCAEQQKADKQQKKEAKKEARQECKKEMLGKIKAILTPEQYVQFLENSFINGGGQQGKPGMQQGQRPGKQDRKGVKQGAQRGERPQRPAGEAPQQ